ncbi:hypothetical protein [Streptomyces sp. NPDC050848]|uniref:hypothetical protein n=1 Tax=Streptomyces sp. NPDC050848 TaxID=3155791 RepID=UPI0033D3E13D
MSLADVYGTRPDLLPRSMVRLVRGDGQGDKRLVWVGRPGIELLDLESHLQVERDTLGRLPRNPDATVDWNAVEPGLVICSLETESADVDAILREYAPGAGSLVFLWGSVVIPSVEMTSEVARDQISAILESSPEFWICSPKNRVLMEFSFSGSLTVAQLPAP